jgi:hypothetical protein
MTDKDWLPELDDDDLAVLVEALEAWESKDAAGEMFDDVVEMIVTGGEPGGHARMREERRIQKLDRDRAKKQRKERSILLRAKLLTLRDRRRVERVITHTPRSDGTV